MLRSVLRLSLLLALLLSCLGLAGCFDANVDDSEIPWTRPQTWENNAPGMGSGPGSTF